MVSCPLLMVRFPTHSILSTTLLQPTPAMTVTGTIDNIDYVTGIGNCIKPEGTMRVVFSTSYLLPVNVRPYIQM